MKHIHTGTGLDVGRIGLGCMGMSAFYDGHGQDEAESIRTLHRAVDQGVTLFDTAEAYGPFTNERLVGSALKDRRDDIVIATKFGLLKHAPGKDAEDYERGMDSSPTSIRIAVEASLQRLGTDRIDVLYQHRVDPAVPIEETVGAMKELVEEGKVLHLGLSEAGPDTIRRAHAVHPIAVLQSASSASASSRTRRSAVASSPARSRARPTSPRPTTARPPRASPKRPSRRTCASSTPSRTSRARSTRRPRRSRSRGSSRRATTSP
jgi:aryl-alcohol dehydrogenase-like predicted oxidoreductase